MPPRKITRPPAGGALVAACLCGCGKRLSGRQREFASDACRKRTARARASAPVVPFPIADNADVEPPMLVALRLELEVAGRLDSMLGQHALTLAQRIASGRESGSAVSSLSKELRAVRAEALKGVGAPESAVQKHRDELAARRARGA